MATKPQAVTVTAPETISQELWREVNFLRTMFSDKNDQSGP